MSHEIQEHDIQEGRSMAWHNLTQVNSELSLANCHLNGFDYVAHPVIVDGKETHFSVLGVTDVPGLFIGRPYVAKSFKPITNKRLIGELTEAIGKQGLTLESCGTIMNRGRQFLSFSMEAAKFNAANRPFQSYLNVGNGNDMSSPLWANTSNTCTVCNNTFTVNMDDKGKIMRVKKTQFSEFKVSELGAAIDAMLRGQVKFAKQLNELAQIQCDEPTAREIFAGFVGEANEALSDRAQGTVESLTKLFLSGNGNDGNDLSDVFQAFTDYYTHQAANGQDTPEAKWKNYLSSEFGAGKEHKVKAWEMLTKEETRAGLILIGKSAIEATNKATNKAS